MSYYFLISNKHRFGKPDLNGELLRTDFRYLRSDFLKSQSFKDEEDTIIPIDEELYSELDFGPNDNVFLGLLTIDKYLLEETPFGDLVFDVIQTNNDKFFEKMLGISFDQFEESKIYEEKLRNYRSSGKWSGIYRGLVNPWLKFDIPIFSFSSLDKMIMRENISERLSTFTKSQNEILLTHPDFCDIILKNVDLENFSRESITRALIILYYEEVKTNIDSTRKHRFIFTEKEFRNIVRGTSRQLFLPKEIIPPFDKIGKKYISNPRVFVDELSTKILTSELKLNHGRIIGNLVGSACHILHRNKNFSDRSFDDIDIRLEYADSTDEISDSDFKQWAISFGKSFPGFKKKRRKISLQKGYKYEIKIEFQKFDIFRAPFGTVCTYHVAPVRINYSNEVFHMFPSYIISALTGNCLDIRYMACQKNPYAILKKWIHRGFSFYLADKEKEELKKYYLVSYKDNSTKYFKEIGL